MSSNQQQRAAAEQTLKQVTQHSKVSTDALGITLQTPRNMHVTYQALHLAGTVAERRTLHCLQLNTCKSSFKTPQSSPGSLKLSYIGVVSKTDLVLLQWRLF